MQTGRPLALPPSSSSCTPGPARPALSLDCCGATATHERTRAEAAVPSAARPHRALAAVARSAHGHMPLLPALGVLLLPKCPLCIAAYAGILGSLGAGSWLRAAAGAPLGAAFLSVTLGAMAVRATRTRRPGPLLAGAIGAAALLAGKFVFDSSLGLYAGVCLLVGASAWSTQIGDRR